MDQEKQEKGTSVKKTETRTMMDLKNIHTGDDKSDPGVLKAKADKAKRDKLLASLKKKKK